MKQASQEFNFRAEIRGSYSSARKRADRYANRANSYTRMPTLLRSLSYVPRDEWFSHLGKHWDCCDNIGMFREHLTLILQSASDTQLAAMMDDDERAHHSNLPESLTVYRGCYTVNRQGLSWTLNRDIAENFPTLTRYRRPGAVPLLLVGTTQRQRAVLKLARKEFEVIATDVTVLSETPITDSND